MNRFEALSTKLSQLREHASSAANWAGASWEIQPPAGEAAVTALELQHGFTLPDDYRRFVTEIADGGAGPDYGLYALATAIGERGDGVWGLGDPFVAPEDTGDWVDFRAPGILPIQYSGCEYYTGLVVSGPERGQVWSYVAVEPGWVPITTDLVDRDGAPFKFGGEDYAGWYDLMLAPWNRGKRRGFLDWYEAWVDDTLRAATAS